MGRGLLTTAILGFALMTSGAKAASRTLIATLCDSPELLFGADLRVDIFAVGDHARPTRWLVRQRQVRGSRAPLETWLDSRRCPAIGTAMAVWPGEAGMKDQPGRLTTVIDGDDYQLRYRSSFPGLGPGEWRAASGPDGSPLGDWAAPFLLNLKACQPRKR